MKWTSVGLSVALSGCFSDPAPTLPHDAGPDAPEIEASQPALDAGKCSDADATACSNCGADCQGTCSSVGCITTIATGDYDYAGLAVTESLVYFGVGAGDIKNVTKDGKESAFVTAGGPRPYEILIHGDTLYWAHGIYPAIRRAPLVGGPSTEVVPATELVSLAVDDAALFWGFTGDIQRMPFGGLDVYPLSMAGFTMRHFAIDAKRIYFAAATVTGGGVFARPLIGGPPVTKYVESPLAERVALSPTRVFWATKDGSILSVDKEGGPIATHVTGLARVVDLETDELSVYWSTRDQRVGKVTVDGTVTLLATNVMATNLALDGTSLYWTSSTGVTKLTPK